MNASGWYLLCGLVLMSMGLTAARIRRLPLTTAICYLAVGIVIGPTVLDLFHFNPLRQSAILERVTELAVILSLFTAGLKMRLPLTNGLWWAPVRLAVLSMAVSVGLVAAFGTLVLDMPLGLAVLLGAILAPTDPVLATDVQLEHARDRDPLRFSLTGEAGLNDGTAFPFVMLGLGLLGLRELGAHGSRWLALDLAFATLGGLAVGAACGFGTARLVAWLRRRYIETEFMDDFLGLGLLALSYGLGLLLSTHAFLSVFAAAVTLRQTESRLARTQRDHESTEAEIDPESAEAEASAGSLEAGELSVTLMASRSLRFNEQLERISEILLILLIGGTLFVDSWTWEAVGIAAVLFFLIRPLATWIGLLGSGLPGTVKAHAAWFGVRGIGSLYYLMYVIERGLPEQQSLRLLQIVLIVVTLSILVHGATVTPLMGRYRLLPHLRPGGSG